MRQAGCEGAAGAVGVVGDAGVNEETAGGGEGGVFVEGES